MKRERERSPLSLEDEQTQTSSPGWQGKLSALNFLHLQVRIIYENCKRKINLRLCRLIADAHAHQVAARREKVLVLLKVLIWVNSQVLGWTYQSWWFLELETWLKTSSRNMKAKSKIFKMLTKLSLLTWNVFRDLSAPPEGASRTRRKSIYSFFLRHQDAVDDHNTSPSVHKKVMKPSETIFSLKGETPTSPPQKSKRATSFIKKKPRLERGLSDQSVLRLNRNATLGEFNDFYSWLLRLKRSFYRC